MSSVNPPCLVTKVGAVRHLQAARGRLRFEEAEQIRPQGMAVKQQAQEGQPSLQPYQLHE